MPDYSKGKIYKIVVDTQEEYKPYVGSTIQTLSNRMACHRGDYKKINQCSSYELFERFGVDKCKIILIEEYPCDNYEQLLSRERYWFDNIECCNKIRPFITKEERIEYDKKYRNEHKEHYKKWTEEHKENLIEYIKKWREEHKENIIEYAKEYREHHKEELAKKRKETYQCLCGSICCKGDKSRHEKSKKHISFISK